MKPIHYPDGTVSLIDRTWPTRIKATDPYVEQFWTPFIGPASIIVLRWAQRERPDHWPIAALGEVVGLTDANGKNSAIWRTLNRMISFGFAECLDADGHIAIWTRVPFLSKQKVEKLPSLLRSAEEAYWQQLLDASNRVDSRIG